MSDFTVNGTSFQRNAETSCSPTDSRVNRRAFLAGMGLGSAIFALSPHLRSIFEGGAQEVLLCVGSFGAGDAGTLHLLQIQHDKIRVLNTHPSARPAAIVRHPFRPLLYIANDVRLHQHQPRGTVETFSFDQATGELELVGRQALSLSATGPRSLAISPDGRSLVVAVFDGGAYNVLPIDESGLPSAPFSILKQVGRGEHQTEQTRSHPSHVLFHPGRGIAVAADYGADRLDVFTHDAGDCGSGKMNLTARIPCIAGSGPSQIAMHPDGEVFVVAHALRPALTAFRLQPEMKPIPFGHASLTSAPTAICFSSGKSTLFAAQSRATRQAVLTGWSIDPQKGAPQQISEIVLPAAAVLSMHSAGSTLWLASDRGIMAAGLDTQTGTPCKIDRVSSIPNLHSMAVV